MREQILELEEHLDSKNLELMTLKTDVSCYSIHTDLRLKGSQHGDGGRVGERALQD